MNENLNKAAVASIYVKSAADVTDGVYTVKLKDITLTDTDGDEYTGEYYFSVFVGQSAGDAILYGNYDATAKATATAALVGGTADITTTNLADFAPNDVLVLGKTNTTYNRTVTGLGTVCLPIDLPVDGAATYYTLKEAGASGVVFTKAETTVPANTPVLVKGNIAVSAEGYAWPESVTPFTKGDWTIKGTYTKMEDVTGVYYAAGDKLYKATTAITINPFRAYLESTSSAKSLKVYLDDETTGLIDITDQLSDEDIYNIQGMKLQKAQRGINIINGKKVLVK